MHILKPLLCYFSGEPEVVDQLILSLGLGSSGQRIDPPKLKGQPDPLLPDGSTPILNSCAKGGGQICQHVTTPHGLCNNNNIIVELAGSF